MKPKISSILMMTKESGKADGDSNSNILSVSSAESTLLMVVLISYHSINHILIFNLGSENLSVLKP